MWWVRNCGASGNARDVAWVCSSIEHMLLAPVLFRERTLDHSARPKWLPEMTAERLAKQVAHLQGKNRDRG